MLRFRANVDKHANHQSFTAYVADRSCKHLVICIKGIRRSSFSNPPMLSSSLDFLIFKLNQLCIGHHPDKATKQSYEE